VQRLLTQRSCMQALGVLLYLMCFGRFPFEAQHHERADLLVVQGRYTMPKSSHSQKTRDLITALLRTDPDKRPDINQVLTAVQKLLDPSAAAGAAPQLAPAAANGKASSAPPAKASKAASAAADKKPAVGAGKAAASKEVAQPAASTAHAARRSVGAEPAQRANTSAACAAPAQATPPASADPFASVPAATKGSGSPASVDPAAVEFNPFAPPDPFAPSPSATPQPQAADAGATAAGPAAPSAGPRSASGGENAVRQGSVFQPHSDTNPFSPPATPPPERADPEDAADSDSSTPAWKSVAVVATQQQQQQQQQRSQMHARPGISAARSFADRDRHAAPDRPGKPDRATPAGARAAESPVTSRTASPAPGGNSSATAKGSAAAKGAAAYVSQAYVSQSDGRSLEAPLPDVKAPDKRSAAAASRRPQSNHNNSSSLDLATALATVTSERDDLRVKLAEAVSELAQRRTQVAEMRSLIEALSNGGSSGPLRGAPSSVDPTSPVKVNKSAQYVTEVLEESEGRALSSGGALRRCNSDINFDWDKAESEAGMENVPLMQEPAHV
jgi:hypothetical protein